MRAAFVIVMTVLLTLTSCARRSLGPPPPPPEMAALTAPPPPNGSLWHAELAANYAALDVRAHFPGDLLTVLVAETSTGKKDASTVASAKSSIAANVQDFFGLTAAMVKFLPKAFTPDSIVKATTERDSTGDATTKRDGTLSASITVRVTAVDQNGNLYIEGDKVVSVNGEDQHIVLSGVVRPEDIATDNTIASTRLADARIDYYVRGVVGDKTGTPLVHKLFDWVWPF